MFLPKKAHGQRGLASYSAKEYEEPDTVGSCRSSNLMIVEHGLLRFSARRGLPGSGIKPMSPALAGGFLTTEPPGKSPADMLISDRQQDVHRDVRAWPLSSILLWNSWYSTNQNLKIKLISQTLLSTLQKLPKGGLIH